LSPARVFLTGNIRAKLVSLVEAVLPAITALVRLPQLMTAKAPVAAQRMGQRVLTLPRS